MFINLSWRRPVAHPRLEKPTVEAPILTQTQSKSLAKKGQLVARWVKDENSRLFCQWVNEEFHL
ncbi:hypothetical protein PL8927_760284 [Planktothrix serta PCC 8927]|uniref:Uncharacterized protein n=1 Tax=Planktothrix serta PCC 8927 TaxID=671068 RepID=A0A7Z9BV36_9CYAN|nr:hypothetical protein [Planktothrix serta]VXD23098.1 hypothetical protein PL8927_760284 [Planktothrix serta PCC 8927]